MRIGSHEYANEANDNNVPAHSVVYTIHTYNGWCESEQCKSALTTIIHVLSLHIMKTEEDHILSVLHTTC